MSESTQFTHFGHESHESFTDISDSDSDYSSHSPSPTPLKNEIYETIEEEKDKSSLPKIDGEDVKTGCLGLCVCCAYISDCYLSMFMTEAAIHVQETTPDGSVEHCCASMQTGTCLFETCGCDGLSECYLGYLKDVNDCFLPDCAQDCAIDVGDCEADCWGDFFGCLGSCAESLADLG